MEADPPFINSDLFNTSYFTDLNGNLTLEAGDLRYIKRNSGFANNLLVDGLNVLNNLTYNGSSVDLSAISGITAGSGLANKALILNSARNISNINQLNSTGSSSVIFSNNSSTNATYHQWINDQALDIVCRVQLNNDSASMGMSSTHPLRLMTSGQTRQFISTAGLIGINNTTPAYQLDINGTLNTSNSIYMNGTEIIDASRNIKNIGDINATTLTGTITTSTQPNITSVGTLTGLTVSGNETTFVRGIIANTNSAGESILRLNPNGNAWIVCSGGSTKASPYANAFYIGNASAGLTPLMISSAGNVSLGNNTPPSSTHKLLVSGSINTTSAYFMNGTEIIDASRNIKNILDVSATSLTLGGTLITATATELNYVDILTTGSAEAEKALVLNSDKDIGGMRHMSITGDFIASSSMASPILTTDSILTSAGTLGITYTTLNLNGASMTASADELNYNDITTLGVAQASKTLTMNSTGLLRIGSGTVAGSNQIKWFNNTALRCSIRMYRTSDTQPLIIADQIDLDRSTNRTYPIMSVVSCPTTTGTGNGTPVAGISATTAPLFNVRMNDASFGTMDFNVGFSYGFGQPFATGFPNVQTLTTDGDALNIVVGSSNGASSTGNFLIDGVNKRTIFNSLTPSQATHTLNGSIFCKGGGWTAGSYEVVSRFESANGGNRVDIQCSTTSGDPCWIGTATNSELRLGVNNSTKMTIDTSGYVGIGTTSPRCPLEISTSQLVALNLNMLSTVYRKRTDNTTTIAETSSGTTNYQFSLWLSEYLYCKAVAMVSDKRLKTDIIDINQEHVSRFYDVIKPKTYYFKSNPTKIEHGVIAQEVIQEGFMDLISMMPNEEMKVEDPEVDIEGVQFGIDYQKITMFNATMIKKMKDELKELRALVEALTSKPALAKWISKKINE